MKKLKKQKEDEQLYQREERKLFLGGLSQDTVEKDLRKHFIQFGEIVVYWLERQTSEPKVVCSIPVRGATTRSKSCASSTLWYYDPNIMHLLESVAGSVIQAIGR